MLLSLCKVGYDIQLCKSTRHLLHSLTTNVVVSKQTLSNPWIYDGQNFNSAYVHVGHIHYRFVGNDPFNANSNSVKANVAQTIGLYLYR